MPATTRPAVVLGLESSCDDTAAAVVRRAGDGSGEILSNVVIGQADLHAAYGGVVPEVAARAHAEMLDIAAERALDGAGLSLSDIGGVAVTAGPGLVGGLFAGVMTARGIAAGAGLPLYGINHLAGHALSPRLTDGIAFPYVLLLASGGHCQILLVEGPEAFTRLGGTIDDAPGEAFDKVARLMGLPQPGGPAVEAEAASGDPSGVELPRPLLERPGCDMSFSGLKTAVSRARDGAAASAGGLTAGLRRNLCAAFQRAVTEILSVKCARALDAARERLGRRPRLAVAGGVAANREIRSALREVDAGMVAPPPDLCTDNGAMIAWAALERIAAGAVPDASVAVRPRWPLDSASPPMLGAGKRGAKA